MAAQVTLMTRCEYWAAAAGLAVSRWLPKVAVRWLLQGAALLFFALSARRRRLALANLEIAFPEWSSRRRWRTALRAYRHFGAVVADEVLAWTGRLDVARMAREVECEGWERFAAVAAASKNGLLAVTGHLGNWELMLPIVGLRLSRPVAVVARELTNGLLEERVVEPLRSRFGARVIHKKNALRGVIRVLRDGGAVGLLIDQKTGRRQGVPVAFFGREVVAVSTPAVLQRRFGVPVVAMFLVRRQDGGYRLEVTPPLELPDAAGDEDAVQRLTQMHQAVIEAKIREYPEQWLWMHDRWRLRR